MIMSFLLATMLNTGGMSCLALGMEQHYRTIYDASPGPNELPYWRRKGWVLLSLGLAVCLAGRGFAIGAVLWTGLLSVALISVAIFLAAHQKHKTARTMRQREAVATPHREIRPQ